MTLAEYYITNLVSERIPMINEWAKMIGLQIHTTTQTEQSAIPASVIAENSGYKMFDKIERAFLSHEVSSLSYSDETHYLLGMYLRALKEIDNLDYMHLYSCIQYSEVIGSKKLWHAPVIFGRTYSVKVNTYWPITVNLKYSNTGISLTGDLLLKTTGSNSSVILGSAGNVIDWEKLERNEIFDEFLELVITTRPEVQASVVEGSFANLTPGKMKSIDGYVCKTIPSVLCNYRRFSTKLVELLLETAITEDSNSAIKTRALQLYPADSIEEAARKYTNGIYDVDGFIDKRLIV